MDNLMKLVKERWYDVGFYLSLVAILLIMFVIENKVDEKLIIAIVIVSFNVLNLIWIYLRRKYQPVQLLWAKRHEWVNFLFIPVITLIMCISFLSGNRTVDTTIFLIVFIIYTVLRSFVRQKMIVERQIYEKKLQAKARHKAIYKKGRKK